jgi:hypothetical protein
MGLGPWSLVALFAALASTFDHPESSASFQSEPPSEPPLMSTAPQTFAWELSQPAGARAFAASFDTEDISRVGSLKVQQRCIRATMDEDVIESIGWRPLARPFRKALDDADLSAPPDPPRYVRLTLD